MGRRGGGEEGRVGGYGEEGIGRGRRNSREGAIILKGVTSLLL